MVVSTVIFFWLHLQLACIAENQFAFRIDVLEQICCSFLQTFIASPVEEKLANINWIFIFIPTKYIEVLLSLWDGKYGNSDSAHISKSAADKVVSILLNHIHSFVLAFTLFFFSFLLVIYNEQFPLLTRCHTQSDAWGWSNCPWFLMLIPS